MKDIALHSQPLSARRDLHVLFHGTGTTYDLHRNAMWTLHKVADDLAIPLLSVEEENKLKKAMEKESKKKAAVRR